MNIEKVIQTIRLGMVSFSMLAAVAAVTGCATTTTAERDDDPSLAGEKSPAVAKGTVKAKTWEDSWGESAGICSQYDRDYSESRSATDYDSEDEAMEAAENAAEDAAREACEGSDDKAWLCRATAETPHVDYVSCTQGQLPTRWRCTAKATVHCTYSAW